MLPDIACTLVRPVTIFTGSADAPSRGGRKSRSGVSTSPPPIPSSPERNDATSPESAATASSGIARIYRSGATRVAARARGGRVPADRGRPVVGHATDRARDEGVGRRAVVLAGRIARAVASYRGHPHTAQRGGRGGL